MPSIFVTPRAAKSALTSWKLPFTAVKLPAAPSRSVAAASASLSRSMP